MADPVTTIGVGAIAAYLGKDGLSKLLGPTADYLGGELQAFAERRVQNVGNVFSKAERKLGEKIDKPGQVPPKVLKTIINEGSYANDELAVEYFGGVLASSRSEVGRDDRGARMARLVDNLSSYQLRTHYLVYSTIATIFKSKGKNFGQSNDRAAMQLYLPLEDYYKNMELSVQEISNPQLMGHIWHGLSTDGLIENRWQFGQQSALAKWYKECPGPGIICQPSSLGAEMYLWALGKGNLPIEHIFYTEKISENSDMPDSIDSAKPTKT